MFLNANHILSWVSQVMLVVKNLPANAGDIKDMGLIPGLGRSPGGGNGSPFQHSCLENSEDRGAWWATVHGFAESWVASVLRKITPGEISVLVD